MRYIDIGLNLFCDAFKDPDRILSDAREQEVSCILTGSDAADNEKVYRYTLSHDVWGTAGIHPHNAESDRDFLSELDSFIGDPKLAAAGEIGLDYHYDLSPRDVQQAVLEREIRLAHELGLPLVFHVREAYEDFNAIIERNREYLKSGVLLHCYSGSAELAKYYRERFGAKFSFGGVLTFAKHKDVVLQAAGIENVMLETDCPYMTPVPHRGTPNEPKYIPLIAEKMAELYGVDVKAIERVTTENAKRFYRL